MGQPGGADKKDTPQRDGPPAVTHGGPCRFNLMLPFGLRRVDLHRFEDGGRTRRQRGDVVERL